VHALTEDKDDVIKDSFYEELEQILDQFPRYHMRSLLGDFNAKVGREDILKPGIGNESVHEASNDNGVRVVNFETSKNLIVSSAKELEQIFDQFPRYCMKIFLGDFNAKVRKEDIFKPISGNESLHEASNDNRIRVVNFATSKNLIVNSTTFINTLGLLLMVSHIIR
jgi:hypothetical protein